MPIQPPWSLLMINTYFSLDDSYDSFKNHKPLMTYSSLNTLKYTILSVRYFFQDKFCKQNLRAKPFLNRSMRSFGRHFSIIYSTKTCVVNLLMSFSFFISCLVRSVTFPQYNNCDILQFNKSLSYLTFYYVL